MNDELNDEGQKLEEERIKSLIFPPPPLPGNKSVVPLDSPAMVLEEGKMQHYCVAPYMDKISVGRNYFYRVLAPERATLLLVCSGGIWFIERISAACNKSVSSETKRAAIEWLLEGQRTLNRRGVIGRRVKPAGEARGEEAGS